MRTAFIDELVRQAEQRANIALVVGDLGFSVVEPFVERFPDRFFNAGVAEQNMTGLAAGMASEGFHVFTYSIANFPTFRCAEQIRNDVDYQSLPVTIVAVGGGLAYGALGYSHHAVQDYALMRVMPNMLIAAPGDPAETRACLRFLLDHPQPSYLRIGKAGEPTFHSDVPYVGPGEWLPVSVRERDPEKILLSTGSALGLALELQKQDEYSDYCVYSLPLWGLRWKQEQAARVIRARHVVTVEDHLIDAGFGSWLVESLTSFPELRARVGHRALDHRVCGLVGTQAWLTSLSGLA